MGFVVQRLRLRPPSLPPRVGLLVCVEGMWCVCVCVCVCMSVCGCGCVGEYVHVCVYVWDNLWVLCGSVHISLRLGFRDYTTRDSVYIKRP